MKYHESLWVRIIDNISKSILKYDLVGIQEVRSNRGGGTEAVSDLQLSVEMEMTYYSLSGFFVQKRYMLPIDTGWFVSDMS